MRLPLLRGFGNHDSPLLAFVAPNSVCPCIGRLSRAKSIAAPFAHKEKGRIFVSHPDNYVFTSCSIKNAAARSTSLLQLLSDGTSCSVGLYFTQYDFFVSQLVLLTTFVQGVISFEEVTCRTSGTGVYLVGRARK